MAGILTVFIVITQSFAQDAQPLKGVALVIGNGQYEHLPPLANPVNDARAVEALLDDLGFETTIVSDRDARRLNRDLGIFLEDAEGADVAVVYYAGHGIEAGGENFLVPVNANQSALEAASETLVPVSAFIERLQTVVPVAIVMLDACRDNPFPPGAVIRLDPGAEPVAIGAGGLNATRGARPLSTTMMSATENVGTVISFAAEPGRVALDGAAGGNSPYAAALLRHFGAMVGDEFGVVMRMVAEEVYLKTSGRQRPWVNESLRRLLYFGVSPQMEAGDEGELLKERRQLLLTIADLPPAGRRLVENVATLDGVPLDALYAMLKTLGQEVPEDAEEFDRLLRDQAERIRRILANRDMLESSDPEIARLVELADRALDEGALRTAVRVYDEAKARAEEISSVLDDVEENLRQRRIETAMVFARSGGARELALDHRGAATDYARAFREARQWDPDAAWGYKIAEANALVSLGDRTGDIERLNEALHAVQEAVELAETLGDSVKLSASNKVRGDALTVLGRLDYGTGSLENAIDAYRMAISQYPAGSRGPEWAHLQQALGVAYLLLGERESGYERIFEAERAFRSVAEFWEASGSPYELALAKVEIGRTYLARLDDSAHRFETTQFYRLGLQEWSGENVTFIDLDSTISDFEFYRLDHIFGEDSYRENAGYAASLFREARTALADDRYSVRLASIATDLAQALVHEATSELYASLAWQMSNEGDFFLPRSLREDQRADTISALDQIESAIALIEDLANDELRAIAPLQWARARLTMADGHRILGFFAGDPAQLREAERLYRDALVEMTPQRSSLEWSLATASLADALLHLGAAERSLSLTEQAVETYRLAIGRLDRRSTPMEWASIHTRMAGALFLKGIRHANAETGPSVEFLNNPALVEAREAVLTAFETYRDTGHSHYARYFDAVLEEVMLPFFVPSSEPPLAPISTATTGRLDLEPFLGSVATLQWNGEPTSAPEPFDVVFTTRLRGEDAVPTLHDPHFLPADGHLYGHFDVEFSFWVSGSAGTFGTKDQCYWRDGKILAVCGQYGLFATRSADGALTSLSLIAGGASSRETWTVSGFSLELGDYVDLELRGVTDDHVRIPIAIEGLDMAPAGPVDIGSSLPQ
ncbi:caspase family protein [Aquibium sp. ELW1220]|uniref:caspase family protein n=1 Tax=Aquibium sp. ELW1220 TaxID=2976766 RepID=UPI0025B134DF|nr:caspase family protein [Aquibium sp. ELW1220]MDN2579016.1 caspase family protein [Aquibium sp. ELW1220]